MSAPVWVLRLPPTDASIAPRFRAPALYWSSCDAEWTTNRAMASRRPTYAAAATLLAEVARENGLPLDARIVRLVSKERP